MCNMQRVECHSLKQLIAVNITMELHKQQKNSAIIMLSTISFVLQPGRVATLVQQEKVSGINALQPNTLLNFDIHFLQDLISHHQASHVGIIISHVFM